MADAQQAAREMQSVQRRLQELDQNLSRLEQTMQEVHTAIATLEGLEGDGVLDAHVPIGGGVRVPATVEPATKVFMDLGKGYSSEVSRTDAIERLRDRLRNTEAAFRATNDEADKTAQRYQALQSQAMAGSSGDASS